LDTTAQKDSTAIANANASMPLTIQKRLLVGMLPV
jgi:hypothetical protein